MDFGQLKSIWVSEGPGQPMQSLSHCQAHQGLGLEGDRYSKNQGFWQTVKKPRLTIRDVSLIQFSAIQMTSFTEADTRRNLVIECERPLIDLVGVAFQIGEAQFLGIEDCTPCQRPSDLIGRDGFAMGFQGRGGLRAQVIKSGQMVVGDGLYLLETLKT